MSRCKAPWRRCWRCSRAGRSRFTGRGVPDAGVHALGQVASVTLECRHDEATLTRGLNAQLPGDVRVLSVVEASADFHARFSARSKVYRYLLRNAPLVNPFERAYVWHVQEPVDVKQMESAAATLLGTHDFSAFQSAGADRSSTIRTLTRSDIVSYPRSPLLAWRASEGTLLAYEVQGDGFLRHMVRAIVGTLVEVGRGRREPDSVGALTRGGTRARAGPTAPAHGLYLVGVDYD